MAKVNTTEIKRLMRRQGIRSADLARKWGVSRQIVARQVQEGFDSIAILGRFAQALDTHPSRLIKR